jgi:hypothetical protein
MVPAGVALAQTANRPKSRFVGIFVPHGMAPGYWVPKSGTAFDMPAILTPLEPYRRHLTILSGLHSRSAEPPPGQSPADHWVASAFMSAIKPKRTAGADVHNGTTIDQLVAQKIGQETLLPSLQLAVEDPGANSSNCGEGYSCAYTNSISWSAPSKPLPMELNPQVVFERMFGDGATASERRARRERNRSVIDSVMGGLKRLRTDLSGTDRARLDAYAEDVREIERRLQIAMQASTVAPAESTVPVGVPESFDEHIKLQFDLLALAFRGDITRVGTLLYARDLTQRTYPESGTTTGFHSQSHHGEDPKRLEEYARLNRYHIAMLAHLVEKLANTPEGDGSMLLDHALILYGSNMGNSSMHYHYDVPHLIVGGASGRVQGDRHLSYPSKTVPTGNLLVSILDKFDIHVDGVGDSTGPLDSL